MQKNLPLTQRNIFVAALVVVLAFGGGFFAGQYNPRPIDKVNLQNKETAVDTRADFGTFWKAWNILNEKNPTASSVSDQDKIYGAISGLVGSLNDPYTVFFKPDEAKAFEEEIAGNFSGIGIEVGIKDKVLTVIAPLKDTPAYRAGIKSGDKILKIDETITTDLSIDKAVKLMRGQKGTPVTLTIFHEGDEEPREVKIIRDVINIPTLDTELRKDGIFVIRLYMFSENSASLFRKAMKQFTESGSDKLILDLRGNPGGYLYAAVDMASWFLPEGKIVVTEDYGNNEEPEIFRSRGYNLFSDKLKFIILIDGGSASASEILAGALRDHGRATLVGEKSFGKGSIQEAINLTPDTVLKITRATWLTPNGKTIAEVGLTPDHKVELTREDLEAKRDPQMDKAVELLLQ